MDRGVGGGGVRLVPACSRALTSPGVCSRHAGSEGQWLLEGWLQVQQVVGCLGSAGGDEEKRRATRGHNVSISCQRFSHPTSTLLFRKNLGICIPPVGPILITSNLAVLILGMLE